MDDLRNSIKNLLQQFLQQIEKASNLEQLEKIRLEYLVRNGKIPTLISQMKTLSDQEKKEVGPLFNMLKQESAHAYQNKKQAIEQHAFEHALHKKKNFDVTADVPPATTGSLHIFTHIIQQLEDIFISMGYQIVTGPEVVTDYYNFQALNIPADHPARELQDTFWLTTPNFLLRTHTSPVQIKIMETQDVPLAIFAPGRVYRNEATDATHDFMFVQGEGLFIDKKITVAHWLATAQAFLRAFFQKEDLQIRARPGYFPFVEPGIEIDGSCPFCKDGCNVCKYTTWIELMGSGMVHPNVLRMSGIDPEHYSGFAWGMGIERLAMVKYGITDIRLFRNGKIDFLNQF